MPTDVFRSVGTTATDLNTGPATIEIIGSTAVFSSALADTIGVGDAIEYGVTPDLAFIHARTDSLNFTVKNKDGGTPVAASAGTTAKVFRAYISLFNWEAQTENTNIAASIRDFDTSTNLVSNDRVMRVRPYADGIDSAVVVISGWTTDATRFIEIKTPVTTLEVGTSQRHTGKAGTGYRLEGIGSPAQLQNATDFTEIEGLVVKQTGAGGSTEGIRFAANNTTVRACVVWTDQNASNQDGIFSTGGNTNHTVENCIVYGWRRGGIHCQNPTSQDWNIRNCTVWDNGREIGGGITVQKAASATVLVNMNIDNCISINHNLDAGSRDYNIRSPGNPGTVNYIGTNNIAADESPSARGLTNSIENINVTAFDIVPPIGTWVSFVDLASGSEDFHLRNITDNAAINAGTDSGVPTIDIDGASRVSPFDIGADEAADNSIAVKFPLFRSLGTTATDLNTGSATIEIIGTVATFNAGLPDNIGVGCAIEYGGTPDLAFIVERISSLVFTVSDKDGGIPTAIAAGATAKVFRAYIDLNDLESQTENINIAASIRNFDTSVDLVTRNQMMIIACYNDGVVDGDADFNATWTTDIGRFITLFAPFETKHVGISQRHTGTAGTGFRTSNTVAPPEAILDFPDYCLVSGLEIKVATAGTSDEAIRISNSKRIFIFGCILWTDLDVSNMDGISVGAALQAEIQNCIIYGFRRAGIHNQSGAVEMTIRNCTIRDCGREDSGGGGGIDISSTITAVNVFNTIVVDCNSAVGADDFRTDGGTYTGNNNIASDLTATPNFTNSFDSRTSTDNPSPGAGDFVIFTNLTAGSEDFHLINNADNDAIEAGAIADAPAIDIDGQTRTAPVDIGADEASIAMPDNVVRRRQNLIKFLLLQT